LRIGTILAIKGIVALMVVGVSIQVDRKVETRENRRRKKKKRGERERNRREKWQWHERQKR
jgi:hypothetical protein